MIHELFRATLLAPLVAVSFVSAACGGQQVSTGGDAAADTGQGVNYPVPYGGTWTTNSGCWFTVAPACGCHYAGDHMIPQTKDDYGLYCDGTMCICYVDSHSTLAVPMSSAVCQSTSSPAANTPLGDVWLNTCGFPPTP